MYTLHSEQIDLRLIESALALTWRTITSMQERLPCEQFQFSYEYFYAYLLSPEFVEKYMLELGISHIEERKEFLASDIWLAIYEQQSWNPQPLIYLLSKI